MTSLSLKRLPSIAFNYLLYKPVHEISNNVVCATSKASDQPAHTLEYSMIVKLLTEHHLEFLSFKGGCTGSSESTLVKMPHCWKSHATAHISFDFDRICCRLHCLIRTCISDSLAFNVSAPFNE